jgi:hypothetical protein
VYREADALLREFAAAMEGTEPHFVIAAKRLVPGVSRKSPDARFLRSYIATVLAPPNIDGEGEDDAVEEEDEDDDEADEQPIRKAIVVPTGGKPGRRSGRHLRPGSRRWVRTKPADHAAR